MKRRVITNNVTLAVLILFAMGVWPVASQEAARLRCQKSGCREGGAALADEEPALIIQSPSDRVIPLVPWMIAFFVLRLAAQVVRQLIPIIRRTLPEVQEAVGHYYDSIVSIDFSRMIPKRGELKRSTTARKRRVKSSGRSVSSNRSLGSLADLIDDTSEAQSSRGASLWYDNDSSSAGYSSAYTSYTTSDDMESQSEFGLSVLSTSESSTDSTYNNYNHGKYDDGDQSRGGESVVSKFLNYISETTPNQYAQQYQKSPQRRSLRERNGHDDDRRPSLDYKLRRSHNADTIGNYSQSGNKSQSRQRRSTVDETNYPSYRSQQVATTTESGNHQRRGTTESSSQRRRDSSNAPESLLITQSPPSSGGVKMRKAAAKTKPKRQDHGNSDNYDKTSKSSSSKRQQQQKQRHDREADKKSSGLHHHLSKFSSSNKDDNENYSTMLSTVDLRSRNTRDSRATWGSETFVAN